MESMTQKNLFLTVVIDYLNARSSKWWTDDKTTQEGLNPILFGVSGVAYFIWGGGQKCPTLVFSKLEMVWQWNLAHIEAILCQVKISCEFSKWRIIFDDVSTTLCNTVKFTSFWYILLTDVVQSSPDTYFQKRWFLLANTTWKWQKLKNYWKKRKKNFSGIFFDMTSSKKGRGSGFC